MCLQKLLDLLIKKEENMSAKGIDISHHQGTFKNKGNLDFIFARTSNGTREDTKFKTFLPEVKKTKRRGVYHYYRTNHIEHPMEEQADLVLSLISGHGMKMFGADYEISDYDDNVLNRETAIQLYGFMLYMVQNEPNINHMVYTGIYTWRDILLPLQGEDTEYGVIDWFIFGIWLPRYGPYYHIWQASADGNERGDEFGVGSTDVDYNEFDGTPEEMDVWLDEGDVIPPNGEDTFTQAEVDALLKDQEDKLVVACNVKVNATHKTAWNEAIEEAVDVIEAISK